MPREMECGRQHPENIIVEDSCRAQDLQRSNFFRGDMLKEACQELLLGHEGAADPPTGL